MRISGAEFEVNHAGVMWRATEIRTGYNLDKGELYGIRI
jgi:hypothetical protein